MLLTSKQHCLNVQTTSCAYWELNLWFHNAFTNGCKWFNWNMVQSFVSFLLGNLWNSLLFNFCLEELPFKVFDLIVRSWRLKWYKFECCDVRIKRKWRHSISQRAANMHNSPITGPQICITPAASKCSWCHYSAAGNNEFLFNRRSK